MTALEKTAERFNKLGRFCARRDIPELCKAALRQSLGIDTADVLVLFGGSIAGGLDIAAQGWLNGVARHLILAGGHGHTTQSLRQTIAQAVPEISTAEKTEAEMMAAYLQLKYGISGALLEKESTNCGNNVTNVLALLAEHTINVRNMIIMQDGTMQQRMDAGFRKYAPTLQIINFAVYQAELTAVDDRLCYKTEPLWGMWDVEQYIRLLMGEMPRLSDNAAGYGPKGCNYIAHVDIPEEVWRAFEILKESYGSYIRVADERFKCK